MEPERRDPCPYRSNGLGCSDMDGPRAGDIIVLGMGGDDPDTALTKLLAGQQPQDPTAFTVGEISRVRRDRVVEYRDPAGQRHLLRLHPDAVTTYKYAHRETLRAAPAAVLATLAASTSYGNALDRFVMLSRHSLRRCAHTQAPAL
ncbi:hypothetical protein JNW90_29335 [Micromonospora sp. STR1s_5]|nr:hypothetical protein [Micromonospora sp. STR1s_5]